jgi:asparagine synthase (glutamine-hydrolysing)
LEAYSAVPISGYKDWLPKKFIADESRFVEAYKQHFNNIDITYCSTEGENSVSNAAKFLEILEQPYKIIENLHWVNGLEEAAAANGCKVILDGQFGNFTISYGDFMTHVLTLCRKHKWISVFREMDGYSKLNGINCLLVWIAVTGKIFKHNVLDTLLKGNKCLDLSELAPVNPALADKWNTKERLRHAGYGLRSSRIQDLSEFRRLITNNVLFSHLGPLDTKFSLANGLARRDPTRDKRVIEFCFSLPGEQYVRNGQERYLIRRAMAGILPDPVRTNMKTRGKQGADWIQRLSPSWKHIRGEIEEMLQDGSMEAYLNISRLRQAWIKFGDSIDSETWGSEVRMLLISLIFHYFVKSLDSNKNSSNALH